jgi:HSP20 family protein
VDIYEEPDKVIVKVDAPGVEHDSFGISLNGDLLTITGERKADVESDSGRYCLNERTSGAFRTSLRLPTTIDAEKASASYRQGVLEIHLPKAPETKAKKITIAAT